MNANEAIQWIHSRRYTGHKNGLENTRALLAALGNPERGFLSLHIAGTNGKGSTAAMCAACLQKSGYVTGLYTSPYLENYRERIRVNGRCIPEAALLRGVREIMAACAALERAGVSPTTFEIGTALAFWHFREAGVQAAVVECGLGGRLDCTNVITPAVSMIAAIGMDHMTQLGDTIEDIAREKAGIIKPGVPAVVMRQGEEIMDVFRKKGAIIVAEEPEPLEITPYGSRFRLPFGEFAIRLPGRHQMRNASLALYGLRASGLALKSLEAGLREAEWPGRLEWLGDTLLDGAHNPQGARTLREYLEEHFPGAGMTLITGMMRDKQVEACASILAPFFPRVVGHARKRAARRRAGARGGGLCRSGMRCAHGGVGGSGARRRSRPARGGRFPLSRGRGAGAAERGKRMEFHHLPVLLTECMDGLRVVPGGKYLDCTLGGGGHTLEILRRGGRVTGIDRDADAIDAATGRIAAFLRENARDAADFRAIRGNFHDAAELVGGERFDGILADLGVSSFQLDCRERGFSYHEGAPLDMRMDASRGKTAADIVNAASEDELTRIFRDYGEENWARQIARVVVDRRPIETTLQLVAAIDAAIPKKVRAKDGSHPARRVFQALRIAVNDELEPLRASLEMLAGLLKPGGRLCVIAFHSLEDRIVKNAFRTLADPCTCPKNIPVCVCGKKPVVRLITRKPITAGEDELETNPRARSATLRIVEKLP